MPGLAGMNRAVSIFAMATLAARCMAAGIARRAAINRSRSLLRQAVRGSIGL
jgi:hypothetical protein